MSLKAIARSELATTSAGISPATILQKRQSASVLVMRPRYRRVRVARTRLRPAPQPDAEQRVRERRRRLLVQHHDRAAGGDDAAGTRHELLGREHLADRRDARAPRLLDG